MNFWNFLNTRIVTIYKTDFITDAGNLTVNATVNEGKYPTDIKMYETKNKSMSVKIIEQIIVFTV